MKRKQPEAPKSPEVELNAQSTASIEAHPEIPADAAIWADPTRADLLSSILEAQNSSEELELDEPLAESEEDAENEIGTQPKPEAEVESSRAAPRGPAPRRSEYQTQTQDLLKTAQELQEVARQWDDELKEDGLIEDTQWNTESDPSALQEKDEEARPDEEGSTDAIDMSKLAAAIQAQDALDAADRAVLNQDAQSQAAGELASQIAEDLALKAYLEATPSTTDEELQALDLEGTQTDLDPTLSKDPVHMAMPTADETGQLDLIELQSCIEAILFMSDKPVAQVRLKELLAPNLPESALSQFELALELLLSRYQGPEHGFELVAVAGAYQFRTKANRAPLAKKLAKVQTQRLSSGGMETLAIIAYRQPVLKEEIDQVRGVDSSYFIRGLMDRKFIEISGRSELPGRPCLYSTTPQFLELLGLHTLSDLPPLREIEQMIPASSSGDNEDNPIVKQMRKLVSQMNSDTSVNLNYDPSEDEKILHEIRTRVQSISVTSPYLEEQKAAEKAALENAKLQAAASLSPPQEGVPPTFEAPSPGTSEAVPASPHESASPEPSL